MYTGTPRLLQIILIRIYLNKSKKVFGGNKCLQGFKSFFNQVNYKRDKSRYFYMY